MTHDELQAIKARAEAATPGPWRWTEHNDSTDDCEVLNGADGEIVCDFGNVTQFYPTAGDAPAPVNRTFIAHARTDVPRLIEEIERLQRALKEAR